MEIVCGKLCYYSEDACRGYTDINVQMASLLFTNVRLGNLNFLAMSERTKLIPLMASLHHPSTVGWVLIARLWLARLVIHNHLNHNLACIAPFAIV